MNYYQILGVSYDSNADAIKKKFRKLSKSCHPDRGGDEKKYQQITEAYTVLGDSTSKQKYDDLLFNKNNEIEVEEEPFRDKWNSECISIGFGPKNIKI